MLVTGTVSDTPSTSPIPPTTPYYTWKIVIDYPINVYVYLHIGEDKELLGPLDISPHDIMEVVAEYGEHVEAKSVCDKHTRGRLERRPVAIDEGSIRYIGKETNRLEEAQVIGVDADNYTEYVNWKGVIYNLIIDRAASAGISPRNLSRLKTKAKNGDPFFLKRSPRNKLLALARRQGGENDE
jgi:hypothetical protein